MKHPQLLFILVIFLIAAVMQWQGVRTRAREAELRQELATLEMQDAQRHNVSSSSNAAATGTMRSSRSQEESAPSNNANASGRPPSNYDLMVMAIENGDLAEATRRCSLTNKANTPWAIDELIEAVTTQEDQLLVLEQAGKSAEKEPFFQIGRALAKKSTFEANRVLLSRADLTSEKRDLAAAAIAAGKIDDDISDHAAWLLKTLKTDQTDPITYFAQSWTEGDFRAANTWMNSLPPGLTRDAAVVGFAPAAARLDGASAVDWALTITDQAQRTSTLESVTKTWKKREPAAAATYLTEKGIEIKP